MNRTVVIAEVGVNHNGDLNIAKKLVDVAKEAGVDIVKFQTFNVDSLVTRNASMADYQKTNTGNDTSQKEMLQKLSLSEVEFRELHRYCKDVGIEFLSTPFDIESIRFLNELQDTWKIPSGEITNYPYLVEIAKTGKKVILSTGMSDLVEIESAINVLKDFGAGDIVLLHCTTEYPAPLDEVNLKAMETLGKEFGCEVGYSDHTQGIEIAHAAVAMGAKVIEKHFTLDRNMPGPDHKASLEPIELKQLVSGIRKIELAIGEGVKQPTASEIKNRNIARKSIVAKKRIEKGTIITAEMLTTKRPGTGISPMLWNSVINTEAIRDFSEDEIIEV